MSGQRVRICRLRADAGDFVSADGGVQNQSGGTGGGETLIARARVVRREKR